MFEMKITIATTPELTNAINSLARAISNTQAVPVSAVPVQAMPPAETPAVPVQPTPPRCTSTTSRNTQYVKLQPSYTSRKSRRLHTRQP